MGGAPRCLHPLPHAQSCVIPVRSTQQEPGAPRLQITAVHSSRGAVYLLCLQKKKKERKKEDFTLSQRLGKKHISVRQKESF